jgi:hypothetical protein
MTICSFFACVWLVSALVPVHGAGSRDTDLARADQLIENKEYDRAIFLLTDYAKRNPNQFEQAQARINKIYQVQDEINRTVDELIYLLLEHPEEDEKILALTIKLKDLENDSNPILADFLSRIHDIALFNVSRNQLRRSLEGGREMLDKDDYEAAFAAYAGGMSIMREEFYTANYGANIHNQARQETERINTVIAAFRQTASQLESVTTELTRAVNSGQHARVPEIMTRLVPAMDRFIAQKQILYTASVNLERILQNLQRANPEMGDRNHLAFIIRVIHGRTDQSIQEGMLGTFDGFWRKSAGSSLDAINRYMETTFNAGLAHFNKQDYTQAVNTLAGIAAYSGITPVFFDKHRQLKQPTAAQTITFNGTVMLRNDSPQFLNIVSLNEASAILTQAAAIPGRDPIDRNTLVNLRNRRITAPQAFEIEQQTRNALMTQQRELASIKTRAVQLDNQIAVHQNTPYIKNAITAIDALSALIHTEEQQSAQRYYNVAQADLDYQLAERKRQLESARVLYEGESRTQDGVTTVSRYPTEALQILTPMLAATAEDISRGNTLLTQLRNEAAGIASNAEIRNLSNRYQASVNELTSVQAQGQAMAANAGSRSAQANALKQEGERLFAEARTAFQRQNYDTSRERLERAAGRLDESLVLQESAELREYRNTQILGLGQQIAMAQNEAIINQVRNLVNTARTLYFAGNFQQAEDSLLRARNTWRQVHAEENEEIVYWQNMIQRAMSASSARVIPPTAPLYAEISQLLSEAQKNYEEGMKLINSGQREQGISKFDEARVQTKEVKLLFPVNQEAGMLELRMDQFTDRRAFNADFERRLRDAIAGTKRRTMESYADILNLAEINPTYPGIRNIVFQAEVDMGIRPPPPNPADIARSRELTASANRILEQNLTSEFEIALTLINEAITLNPNNTDAPRIKDRILGRSNTTERSSVVLSTEDEAQYQMAVQQLTAGNNLTAYAIVERLMQNPRNRNVPKVIDLQRRIQLTL